MPSPKDQPITPELAELLLEVTRPERPGKVFVLAPTRQIFENVCKVDWRENPKDQKFVVFTNTPNRSVHGRRWEENDEIRLIAPGSPLLTRRAIEEFVYTMLPLGLPEEQERFVRSLL